MSNENGMPKKNVLSAQIDLRKFDFATEEEKKQQDVMSESTTFFKDSMKRLRKNPLAMAYGRIQTCKISDKYVIIAFGSPNIPE